MKIGIYTFTAANNYGAVLQAYALNAFLKRCGYDSHCVDYRPSYLVERYKPFSNYRLKSRGNVVISLVKELCVCKSLVTKNKIFESFKSQQLSLISPKESVDMAIIGSDQVWNWKITKGDKIFMGAIPSASKVITYAASMEDRLNANDEKPFGLYINKLSAISVRELSLKSWLNDRYEVDSTLVVDPTILLSKEDWCEIEQEYEACKSPYLFMYGFGFSEEDIRVVNEYAKKKSLKVIRASSGIKANGGYSNDISPQQFIYLVHHANCVITNSFHGTAFSLIMGTPFAVIAKRSNKRNIRIESILSLSGLNAEPVRLGESFTEDSLQQLQTYPDSLKNAIIVSQQYLKDNIR